MATRPTLKKGMSGKAGTAVGDAIFLWRNFIGLPPAKGVTVFDFGTQTHDRTKAWQAQQKLTADGIVGAKSWAKYDSLQYGPPAAPVVQAATQAASALKQEVEAPAPAAVQAAQTIQQSTPAPKPSPAAVAASKNISAAVTPPPAAITIPRSLEEAKVVTRAVTQEVVKKVEAAPLWLRITGSVVGGIFAIKGIRKIIGM